MSIADNIKSLKKETDEIKVKLLAVSKTKPAEDLQQAYDAGQRLFGENTVQEMVEKQEQLPKDIEWHLIGHLQSNKVKYIAPFVSMIQSVDSIKLLQEINKHAEKNKRVIDCLLQIYIADEETKFGLGFDEVIELLRSEEFAALKNIRIRGLMGIATNTDSEKQIKDEYYELKTFFDGMKVSFFRKEESFDTLSMGMSSDYKVAIEQGSNLVRLGSTIFGSRVKKTV
ncbi:MULTISPECIES: YggS family pyridoxal phosphate-dependent enzyme [unclassified Mucilaginibacter]|uniref:YggS family pyridoxal phosphate-dependent enzyme n=1 Tax=unclassified Mucilaginibacter TaxID=2617802 RepID=UPI002AC953A0|nr:MULTISPECIES: YggS family pyridoxal phosphate-dependent enzyme [unclassified Mucilaginibacter]MEB0261410.1 YggS family pyridoxal phosphate-dependent enzyme [Mucilaginibacter sp. 10I4]MEB0278831.1 YggS family pyridoxal phosphate-dependent enzyme [Mucilaginibacter sp. 10B2]MEB0299803.1 YggS family pyridoxal phosphate-dependent enzyme [Mucilaginibacter sp. 5C4]WPX22014.1 YggS family pyridoxal phosphate-dependent enzyme [Mucilaginibacter sp. 5C4]